MISSVADGNALAAIFDVREVKAEYFPWSQSSLHHQEHHGFVTPEVQRSSQLRDLFLAHGARHPLNRLHPHSSANWPLTRGPAHKRAMAFGNACESRIIDFLDRVFPARKQICDNEVLVEGRDSGQKAIDGGR